MVQSLPSNASLENLQTQAKTLLREWRAGGSAALRRIRDQHPQHVDSDEDASLIGAAKLTDCQLILAREYGFETWDALRLAIRMQNQQPAVELFKCGLLDYTGRNPTDIGLAKQLVLEFPDLAETDVWTAAALGNVEIIRRFIDVAPESVNQVGGPNKWPPLMYLCYSRITDSAGDPLAAAELLINRGADPNAAFRIEDCHFTCLSGVIGEGEAGAKYWPPHARAAELAELLLVKGADPNDGQGLYNSMFSGGTHWLELLLAYGLNHKHKVNWVKATENRMLDYLLVQAAKYDQPDRVELLLKHRADPNATCFYDKQPCYSHAVGRGNTAVAEILIRAGATKIDAASDKELFINACMASDDATLKRLEREHSTPVLRRWASESQSKVGQAAEIGKSAAISTMLRFGFPIHNALFDAAWNGQLEIARLLIENGASARLRHLVHHVTPVAFANRAGHFDVRDYLLEQDVDIFDAIRFERPDLVARVLKEDHGAVERSLGDYGGEPKRANETPLVAAVIRGDVEAVQLLLAAGANRDACDHRGRSLIQIAASEDLPEIAALL